MKAVSALFLLVTPWFAAAAAPARELAAYEGAHLQRPEFSGDAARLAFEANYRDRKTIELFVGDPRSGSFGRVVSGVRSATTATSGFALSSTSQVTHELDWGPAGKFVYSASNADREYDLYLGQGGPIATDRGNDGGPAWSPDGRFIAFTSSRTGQGDVYLLDLSAAERPLRQLTNDSDGSELFLAWSPDSTRLAFVGATDQGHNLWWVDGLDSSPRRITTWSRSQLRPSFSPDGSRIAFFADHDVPQRFDLYVVDTKAGATPVRLATDVLVNPEGPSFTPDGRAIIVALDDDARFDPIAAVSVAQPGATPKILDFGTVGHRDIDVARGPDGRVWIAYTAQGRTADAKRTYDRLFIAELPALP